MAATTTEAAEDVHDEDQAATGGTGRPDPSPPAGIGLTVALLAVGVLAVAWRIDSFLQWSWFQDDWSYLERAHELAFWDFVTLNYNGHLMPLQFAAVWLLERLAPLDFTVAIMVPVALFALGLLGWSRLLLDLFGRRWRVLPLVAILALSPVWVPMNLWWAASLQSYGLFCALGWTLALAVRWMGEGRRRYLALSWLAFALGVLWWEKSLLIAVPLAVLCTVAPNAVVGPDRALLPVLRRAAPLLGGVAVIGALGSWAYLQATRIPVPGQPAFSDDRTAAGALEFVRTSLSSTIVPSTLGGPWVGIESGQSGLPVPSSTLSWVYLQLVVVAVVWLLVVRRRGWGAVLLVASTAVLAWGLVFFSNRYEVVGLLSATDARYSAEIVPLVVLALGFAASSTVAERRRRLAAFRLPAPRRVPAATAGILATLLVVNSALITSNRMVDAASANSPKGWSDAFTTTMRDADGAAVADGAAPPQVIFSALFGRDGDLSRMSSPLGVHARWNAFSTDLRMVDDGGHLVPAAVQRGTGSATGPIPGCGYLVKRDEWTFVPMQTPVFAWYWGVSIPYFSQTGGTMILETKKGTRTIDVPPGVGTLDGVVIDELNYLRLSMRDGGPTCVDNISIGAVVPRDGAP